MILHKEIERSQQNNRENPFLTFNSKGRSLRRLPKASEGVKLEVGSQSLDQAYGHGAFTLTEGSWCYTR